MNSGIKLISIIIFAVLTLAGLDVEAAPADLSLLRDRLIASLISASGKASIVEQADRVAATFTGGTWPDVDFNNRARNLWLTRDHLDRMLLMAKSVAISRQSGRPDSILTAKTVAALAYWLDHDPQNPNWWWNEIGVPQNIAETSLLLGTDLPESLKPRVIALLERAKWAKWTGQNLVWGVTIQIMRGLLQNDSAVVQEAYARMYDEIIITAKDGIQSDFSFHQHGDQLYSGSYGLGFANDVGRYISLAWGTPFQIPADKLELYNHYVLDGEAWMVWGRMFDFSAVGREITRKGKSAAPASWTNGPVTPAGAAYGLPQTVFLLSQLPIPRQSEYESLAKRLASPPESNDLVGHKHFYRSDYSVHRRADFLFTVKMFSTRTQNTELVNDEGKLSHHLGDGNTFLYLTGEEYSNNIFPCWNWNRLPGTTAEQPPATIDKNHAETFLNQLLPHGNRARGLTSFVGGVSDGMYGASAMILLRGRLAARKSYFFFDDEILCLGSNISCPSDNPVVTTLEQSRLNGPVTQGPENNWLHHNHIGYVSLLPNSPLVSAAGPETGAWSLIGTGSSTPVTQQMFTLGIDHGVRPRDSSYAYLILPNSTAAQTAARASESDLEILAQSAAAHAVRHRTLDLTCIVFFSAGTISDVQVDHPCIVMLRRGSLTACNPENQPLLLHVTIKNQKYILNLPDAPMAGSSVTIPLQ